MSCTCHVETYLTCYCCNLPRPLMHAFASCCFIFVLMLLCTPSCMYNHVHAELFLIVGHWPFPFNILPCAASFCTCMMLWSIQNFFYFAMHMRARTVFEPILVMTLCVLSTCVNLPWAPVCTYVHVSLTYVMFCTHMIVAILTLLELKTFLWLDCFGFYLNTMICLTIHWCWLVHSCWLVTCWLVMA